MFGFGYNVFGQICGLKEKKCDNYGHGGLSVDGTPGGSTTTEVIDAPVQLDSCLSEDVVKVESTWTNTFLLKREYYIFSRMYTLNSRNLLSFNIPIFPSFIHSLFYSFIHEFMHAINTLF